MDFENEEQRQKACHTLMLVAGRSDLWPQTGPTEAAQELRDQGGGSISPGERVMLLAAFTLWDGDDRVGLSELTRLSPKNLFAVGSLLAALAVDRMQLPSAPRSQVEEWIRDERRLVLGE